MEKPGLKKRVFMYLFAFFMRAKKSCRFLIKYSRPFPAKDRNNGESEGAQEKELNKIKQILSEFMAASSVLA